MRDVDQLINVGTSAAEALISQDEWIHRRVESITFPFPSRPVYRRHVSVDFTIPSGLVPVAPPGNGTKKDQARRHYYVPLSLIRRWPPLPTLNLRDPAGLPNPFLTAAQNAWLDSATMIGAARLINSSVSDELIREIAQIAAGDTQEDRERGLQRVIEEIPASTSRLPGDIAHRAIGTHPIFRAHAQALVTHTLLWLRVEGCPEERTIVKFSYEIPLESRLDNWSKRSFGLEPFLFEFTVPYLGATSSYHCNVVAPPPLEVVRAEMGFSRENPSEDPDAAKLPSYVDSARRRPVSQDIDLFAGLAESQAKFYASGDQVGLKGSFWVSVLIQNKGFLRGSIALNCAIVAILVAFVVFLSEAVRHSDAAVAVLLISPAVLGYLYLQPTEEAFVGGFLVGLRRIIMLSGAPPVAAAAAITLSNSPPSPLMYLGIGILALIQTAILGAVTYIYVEGNRWRKLYTPHSDAML